jgi:hypothetical protein
MKALLYFGVFTAGVVVGARLLRADDSSCCERFNNAARDKIAAYAGPFSGAVSSFLDASGFTKLIAGGLDAAGVSKG